MLTQEHIVATVEALPVQGRIMLRLLLLQYLDVTQEDIQYMAADRPDPRFLAGGKPLTPHISQETLQGIADRAAQYRTRARQRRERLKLQIDCMKKFIAMSESLAQLCERLLSTQLTMSPDAVKQLQTEARAAVPKPALRELNRKWDVEEIAEEDYRRERLGLELQRLLRRMDTDRKRLAQSVREYDLVNNTPLQDHEIAHIWGIPAGALAARKAKYLHQFMQGLQSRLAAATSPAEQASTAPLDLWKETLTVLSRSNVERSSATYDGLEGTETALIEKLRTFAAGRMPEELETRFWLSIIQESRHQAEYGSTAVSVFALQRLSAILDELDLSPEALESDLLARIAPTPKVQASEEAGETADLEPKLGEMGQHVLQSFKGESHTDLQGRR